MMEKMTSPMMRKVHLQHHHQFCAKRESRVLSVKGELATAATAEATATKTATTTVIPTVETMTAKAVNLATSVAQTTMVRRIQTQI